MAHSKWIYPRSPAGRISTWDGGGVPHPDSPAARTFDWTSAGVMHPDAPAAHYADTWQGVQGPDRAQDRADSDRIYATALLSDQQAVRLRSALPDARLSEAYDRWLRDGPGRARADGDAAAQADQAVSRIERRKQFLARAIRGWEDRPEVVRLATEIAQWRIKRGNVTTGELGDRLDRMVRLETTLMELAGSLLRADRGNREGADRLLQWLLANDSSPVAARAGQSAQESRMGPASRQAQTAARAAPAPMSAQKTWVEFKLVDEDGQPVGGAAYRVTLPDGTVRTGTLDDEGTVRFGDIEPGNCEIAFPHLETRTWERR